ncbi:hypothetical protein ACWIID_41935 [Streptomyces phaeochromogenes]
MAGLVGDEPADGVVDEELPDRCGDFARVGQTNGDLSCQIWARPGRHGTIDQDHGMRGGDLQETVCVVLADTGTHQQKWAAW